jgi:hypothetical protein
LCLLFHLQNYVTLGMMGDGGRGGVCGRWRHLSQNQCTWSVTNTTRITTGQPPPPQKWNAWKKALSLCPNYLNTTGKGPFKVNGEWFLVLLSSSLDTLLFIIPFVLPLTSYIIPHTAVCWSSFLPVRRQVTPCAWYCHILEDYETLLYYGRASKQESVKANNL